MNKKLKKMIATVSAVAMCATSMISASANAFYYAHDGKVDMNTMSFRASQHDVMATYYYSEEVTNYFGDENIRFFISEPLIYEDNHNMGIFDEYIGKEYRMCMSFQYGSPCATSLGEYELYNDELPAFEEYLKENNIEYYVIPPLNPDKDCAVYIPEMFSANDEGFGLPSEMTIWDAMPLITKIKEDTGLICTFDAPESAFSVESVAINLPEPTLTGDANEDGEVNSADAVYIMQSLSNPDEYQLTPQGLANADMDGDGVTALDALRIQEMMLNK